MLSYPSLSFPSWCIASSVIFRVLFLIIIVIGMCTGCHRKYLTARSEAIDCEYLASFYVDTPDPRNNRGFCGQQIVVEWNLPSSDRHRPNLNLVLSMITTNHRFEKVTVPLRSQCGNYIYRLTNQCLCEKGAVLTYKAEIYSGNNLLQCWQQQGWVDWISYN